MRGFFNTPLNRGAVRLVALFLLGPAAPLALTLSSANGAAESSGQETNAQALTGRDGT
jgi:hypothetical protein